MGFLLQQCGSVLGLQLFDAAEFPVDGTCPDAYQFVQVSGNLLHMLLGGSQNILEPEELRLDSAQHLPDFIAALLDGKGVEAHLQRIQQSRHGAWPSQIDLILLL